MKRLTRILQLKPVFADKPGEQKYSAGFPAKRVAEQALCAQFQQGFTPREARPNSVRGKFPTETFGLILFSVFLSLSHPGASALDLDVRVFSNKPMKELEVKKLDGSDLKINGKKIQDFRLRAEGRYVIVKKKQNEEKFTKASFFSGGFFSLESGGKKRVYTGTMTVTSYGNSLMAINTIELETYLLSVVGAETQDLENYQALKAQAVVARTYTLANMNRHKVRGYNLCDTTHCQLYNGFLRISGATRKAVESTRGEILVYKGRAIWAFYHSICGGQTEDPENLWQYEKKPYLKSVVDGPPSKPYCANAYGFKWRTKIGLKTFEKFLRKKIIAPNEKFKDINVLSYSPSGRAVKMEIITDKSIKTISGTDFYHLIGRVLGWNAVRSTKFRIYYEKNYVVFEGYGSGHGVGMCQHGADGMAKLGYNYREILNHYYKDVKMIKLKE